MSNMLLVPIGVVDQLQEIDNTLFDIQTKRWIDVAEGAQLDGLGEIVGRARSTDQSDDDYRPLLRVQMQLNLSKGETERLIAIVEGFTGSTIVQIQDVYPAKARITFNGTNFNPTDLKNTAERAAASGVRVTMVQQSDHPFGFAGDPDAYGFGDGEFSSIVGE